MTGWNKSFQGTINRLHFINEVTLLFEALSYLSNCDHIVSIHYRKKVILGNNNICINTSHAQI